MRRLLLFIAFLVCLFLCSLVALRSYNYSALDLSPVTELSQQATWHPVVNAENNAYHLWRMDPLLIHLQKLLDPHLYSVGMSARALYLTIFFLGTFLFLGCIASTPLAMALALLVAMLSFYVVGPDSVALGSFVWSAWYAWALHKALQSPARKGIWTLLVLAFACRLSLSANQLAVVLIPTLAWMVALIRRIQSTETGPRAYLRFLVILSLIPALFVLFTAPTPEFPSYPQFARVVSEDGVPGIVRPLVGVHASIPLIDRWALRSAFGPASLAALLISLVGFFVSNRRSVWLPVLILFSLVALDTLPPEGMASMLQLKKESKTEALIERAVAML